MTDLQEGKTKCKSSIDVYGDIYPCEKRINHKGYHKSGFHAW